MGFNIEVLNLMHSLITSYEDLFVFWFITVIFRGASYKDEHSPNSPKLTKRRDSSFKKYKVNEKMNIAGFSKFFYWTFMNDTKYAEVFH